MKNFLSSIKNYIKNTIIPIFTKIQWLEIKPATYVRWILTILASLNTVLLAFDINPIPFSEDIIYTVVSVILNIIILVINTYKNNSTSKEALFADKIIKALKLASESEEETALKKLQDVLEELNSEHTNLIESDDKKEE